VEHLAEVTDLLNTIKSSELKKNLEQMLYLLEKASKIHLNLSEETD